MEDKEKRKEEEEEKVLTVGVEKEIRVKEGGDEGREKRCGRRFRESTTERRVQSGR